MVRSTLLFALTLLAAGSQARPQKPEPKHEAEEAAAMVTKTIIQVVAAPPVTVVQKVFVTEAVTVCDNTDTILLDSSTDALNATDTATASSTTEASTTDDAATSLDTALVATGG